MSRLLIFERGISSVRDNISKNLTRHGIVVGARCRAEFRAATQWTAWRPAFSRKPTSAAGRFAGLSTRTLEKCRYKGRAIVEIMFNADDPLWLVA
jgi:hypothetical protein